jgi:DNA-binding beta-propeller fold protein YncE
MGMFQRTSFLARAATRLSVVLLGACETGAARAPASTSAMAAATASSMPTPPATPVPGVAASGARAPTAVPLPAGAEPAAVDYLAYEPGRRRVWIPEANTGSVDVFDVSSSTFARIAGFKTATRDMRGAKRTLGPSAVTIGDGFAYIGNRATSEVCPIAESSLEIGRCITLDSPTDGVVYVPAAKEVWVTTPRAQSIVVLDASNPASLARKTAVRLDGAPEGYAVDPSRGLLLTNLEEKNETVAIDIVTHRPKTTWNVDCRSDGPRGVAVDSARGFVFVACTDRVLVLDGARDGATIATIDTGEGIDNIDWLGSRRLIYGAAAGAGTLTIAHVGDDGKPVLVSRSPSALRARNAVVDEVGNAYVVDPVRGELVVLPAPR